MGLKLKGIILLVLLALICSTADTIYALRVAPGKFDHFTLQLPEQVTAGEKVTIKVLPQDAHDNLITNFSEAGRAFKVSASVSATVQPSDLTPASFQGGAATFNITARKAEKLTVYIHEINSATPVLVKEIAIAPNKPEPISELAPALVPGRAPAEKIEKAAKETRKPQEKTTVFSQAIKEKSKDRLKKSKAADRTTTDIKKPSKTQTAATAPVLPPVQAAKKIPDGKTGKADTLQSDKLFTITDISLMEAGGKGLLVISGAPSSGAVTYKYRKAIEHKLDREWLKISITPAIRKIAGEVRLKSELIGDILFEENRKEKDMVNIYIELKTNKLFHDISEQKNAFIIMFSKAKL